MKERRRFISILFLFLIMGNFIIGNATTIVNAVGANLVEDEITENLSNISLLKNKINDLKLDSLYASDKALYEVTNYMEREVLLLEQELNEKKTILEEGILLKDIIENYFNDRKTIYETFFINDETKIIPTEINDIKYMEYNEGLGINEEKTLLTKEEVENALYNTYLKTTDEKITGYLSVFDTTKESYINTYNGVKTNKDNKVSELEIKKLEITAFYDAEVLNGNTPNMVVADTDIRDYIENSINNLNEEVANYTFEEMAEKTNNLDTIYNDALDKINTFYLNNKSYKENGLKEKIENFNISLNEINNDLAQEIVVDDYKNEDVSKLLEAVDDEFITVLKGEGFDGMLVTDHDSYNGYRHWKNVLQSKHPDFVVFKGIEYDTCDAGHIIIIMPQGVKMRLLELKGLPVAVLIDFVHRNGGILGPAHPFGVKSSSAMHFRNMDHNLIERFDFVETFNTCESELSNTLAGEMAEKYGLPAFGGSDAHEEQYVGMSATIIDADIRCNNDLIKAVKEKKAIMATGTVREETLKSKSKDHWIGVTAFRLYNRGLAKLIAPYRKLLHMQLPFRV